MPNVLDMLKTNLFYLFLAVGVAWIAVVVITGSLLILWPVAACLVSALLLKFRPGRRLTWSWTASSAVLGSLISAYQVYAWAPFIGGAFSTLAGTTVAGFLVFTLVHVLLLYTGVSSTTPPKPATV